MLVREVMTPNPITVKPDSDYLAAIALMRAAKCRHLPVVEEGKRLVGIITVDDLQYAGPPGTPKEHAIRRDGVLMRVHEVMTTPVVSVSPNYPIEDAARLMVERRIGCLPVVEDGAVIGIITDTDLFHILVKMLGGGSATIRLTVRVDNRPGEFAALTEHVASINGNILALASYPAPTPDRLNVTLRVEGVTLDDLLDAVQRLASIEILHIWNQTDAAEEEVS
jgi:acetoin utilization protein AcuB